MDKRLRTYWIVKKRYRRLAAAAAALGGLAALAAVARMGGSIWQAEHHLPATFIIAALAIVLLAILLPRWMVLAIWKHQYRSQRQRWE